jgi:hypothetical protein
LYAKC